MQNLFIYIFDIVFPASEDTKRVRNITPEHMALLYAPQKVESITTLSTYRHPDIHALVHEAKFYGNNHATNLLAVLVDIFIASSSENFDSVIPIPLSPSRKRSRGYNQVYEILLRANISKHVSVRDNVIRRVHDTTPQTELSRNERLKNMEGAFEIRDSSGVRGKRILLIDDVMTTGATLRAAKAALLPHSPASITCCALAH